MEDSREARMTKGMDTGKAQEEQLDPENDDKLFSGEIEDEED